MSKTTLRILCIHSSKYLNFIRFLHDSNNSSNKQELDALDDFTTKLVQKKSEKWEIAKTKKSNTFTTVNISKTQKINNEKVVLTSDLHENDSIFISAIDNCDVNKVKMLIERSISLNATPSFKVAERIMSFCSQNTIKELIFVFDKFISKKYPDEYLNNSNFKHYKAEFYWLRGNIKKSLDLFEEVYCTNQHLRKKVKFILRCLIVNIVHESSEATLISVINFTRIIAEQFDDYYLLAYVWQNCFLSDWFADQCTANTLIEENKKLPAAIDDRIPYILNYAVKEHKPEILYRLMEVLLKYQKKECYTRVLQTLFDYKYRSKDLRSCAEIVQWSISLKIPLTTFQHEQFLTLLLGHKFPKKETEIKDEPKPTGPNFKLKF